MPHWGMHPNGALPFFNVCKILLDIISEYHTMVLSDSGPFADHRRSNMKSMLPAIGHWYVPNGHAQMRCHEISHMC